MGPVPVWLTALALRKGKLAQNGRNHTGWGMRLGLRGLRRRFTSVSETMKTLLVRTLDQWRDWLTEHHASESEAWLIFHKRHTAGCEKGFTHQQSTEVTGRPDSRLATGEGPPGLVL